MTGTVTSIEVPGTFCLITDPTGKVFFAHRDDFLEPATMVVGTDVECHLKIAGAKGRKYPPATDVVAIQRRAA
jgi:hypothetical protein